MRKRINQIISLMLFGFIVFCMSCTQQKNGIETKNSIKVIPQPKSVKSLNSSFAVTSETRIITNSKDDKILSTAQLLSGALSQILENDINVSSDDENQKNIIVLSESGEDKSLGKEGYTLIVDKNRIMIKGQPAGLFYGMQTLLQLIPVESAGNDKILIPACEINDQPRFVWRGMHLDVSRHFFGPKMIKKYIDIMAMYKLNTFHWHLTDDQGWRIEIEKYPLLTEIGAWREGTGKEKWNYIMKPVSEGKPRYGGYYTKKEVREIIEYAAKRFITVVPEIELPGHSFAALLSYPDLSCSGIPWKKPNNVPFEFSDPFCAGNDKTFEFFDNILSEVIDLFPSEYIHIGGDECKKTPWEHCEKCQKRMATENLENVEELQSYFIKRIEKIVMSKGRRIIGWNEILEGGLAPEATVMSWQGEKGGIEAAKHGNAVVMTPGKYLYFNRDQFIPELTSNPKALFIKDVYNYNPVPAELNAKEQELIWGAQGCLWSEFLYSEEILEVQLLPRLQAMAEMVWTSMDNKDWNSFQVRLESHLPRLDMMGYNYYVPSPTGIRDEIFVGEKTLVEFDDINNILYRSSNFRYTLDGSEPNKDSKIYTKPFYVNDQTVVKAKTFMLSGGTSLTTSGKYTRVDLQDAVISDDLKPGIGLQTFTGNISTLDDFSKMKSTGHVIVDEIKIPKNMPEDHFGLIFTGYIDIPTDGVYTFYITSDDGTRFYLDGDLLINNDGIHAMVIKNCQAALAKGKHEIKLMYFENNYGEGLKVEFEGPGLNRQKIPGTVLFRK